MSDSLLPHDLVRLAKKLGARSMSRTIGLDKLERTPLPLIALGRDGGYFLIAGVREGAVLVQAPHASPETIDFDELMRRWAGSAVLITTRESSRTLGQFDVTWFIPALVKYRGLLGEVLVASLVIQLFALATPLIFQVVIDKVLGSGPIKLVASAAIG